MRPFQSRLPLAFSRAPALAGLAATAGLAAACPAPPAAPDAGTTVDAGPDGGLPDAGPQSACTPGQAVFGPAPARLLTRHEYNNVVRDVLGDSTHPADALPEENAVLGFDNSAEFHVATPLSVTKMLDVAEDVAARAGNRLATLRTCDPTNEGLVPCGTTFIREVGQRLFRRPLEQAEVDTLVAVLESDVAENTDDAFVLVLTAMLQSPQFLYRLEDVRSDDPNTAVVPVTPYALASRLSFLVWASGPDDALLAKAADGSLTEPAVLRAETERLLADPRTDGNVRHFYNQWLHLSSLDDADKDAAADYPGGIEALRHDLKESLHAFTLAAFRGETGGLTQLLSSPDVYASAPLAKLLDLHGADTVGDVQLPLAQPTLERRGLLTQPALMARLAHPDQSSPIHRGIFVREQLLCQTLPPPPNDLIIEAPDPDPNATTRERFAEHTANPSCQACHTLIDPIGFGFESYDEIGRYRTTENGLPVDVSGSMIAAPEPGMDGDFHGAVELADRLTDRTSVAACVATQWFRYGMARGERTDDACALEQVQNAFVTADGDFAALVMSIATGGAFTHRASVGTGTIVPLPSETDAGNNVAPDAGAPMPQSPIGFLDAVNDGRAVGWAADLNAPSTPLSVEFYLDGPRGAGIFVGSALANTPRADVLDAHPALSGPHGFNAQLGDRAYDGLSHTLHVMAVDATGDADSALGGTAQVQLGVGADTPVVASTPNQHAPRGFIDTVGADGYVRGWTYDADAPDRAVTVAFFLDGPQGTGTPLGTVATSKARPDVVAAFPADLQGTHGHVGYSFSLPTEAMDGAMHTVHAYALNVDHPGNTALSGAPFSFTVGGQP